MLTTYTIKSKNSNNIWIFKYSLNGFLNHFEVLEGTLSEKQEHWLDEKGNFPIREKTMAEWKKNLKENFEIQIGEPDLSFDAAWIIFNNKVKKVYAMRCWAKLSKADIVLVFIHIPKYLKRIAKTKEAQAHFATYLNQRYFEDED